MSNPGEQTAMHCRFHVALLCLAALLIAYPFEHSDSAWHRWPWRMDYYTFYAPVFAIGEFRPIKPLFDWYFYNLWQAGFDSTPEPGEVLVH